MDQAAKDDNVVVDIESNKDEHRRIVSMEDPFKAFQVISQNANLDFVSKLGRLLNNVAEVMK